MPSLQEIVGSIHAAYRLARLDESAMLGFNLTFEGFWRSFFALVIVAPGYAVLVARKLAGWDQPLHLPWAIGVETVSYVLGWAAFPIAAIFLTRMLGLAHYYVPLIVATNWAAVLQMAAFLAAMLLALVMPAPLQGLIMLVATVAIIAYQWFVIRTALETTGNTAFALLVVDLLLSSLVNAATDGLL